MPTQGFVTIQDRNREKSTTQLNLQDVSALNYGSVSQDLDELKDAIATMSSGGILVAGLTKTYPESATIPTDPNIQRENKWLVVTQDTTQFLDAANTIANPGYLKVWTSEIACANVGTNADSRLKPDSDDADPEHSVVAAFITVWQANARSPWNGGANAPTCKVLRITRVGRNT